MCFLLWHKWNRSHRLIKFQLIASWSSFAHFTFGRCSLVNNIMSLSQNCSVYTLVITSTETNVCASCHLWYSYILMPAQFRCEWHYVPLMSRWNCRLSFDILLKWFSFENMLRCLCLCIYPAMYKKYYTGKNLVRISNKYSTIS